MKRNLTNATYAIGTIAIMIGVYMKLNFIEYGFSILLLGLLIGELANLLHISNLKKTIIALEKEKKELEQRLNN
jgi:hypothetical protein